MTKKEREFAVKQAIANEELEGLKVSAEARHLAGEYIAGKISLRQAAHQIRARYGNK